MAPFRRTLVPLLVSVITRRVVYTCEAYHAGIAGGVA
jgi:hypothetical protein